MDEKTPAGKNYGRFTVKDLRDALKTYPDDMPIFGFADRSDWDYETPSIPTPVIALGTFDLAPHQDGSVWLDAVSLIEGLEFEERHEEAAAAKAATVTALIIDGRPHAGPEAVEEDASS